MTVGPVARVKDTFTRVTGLGVSRPGLSTGYIVFGLAPVEYRNCICRDLTDLAILPRVTYHVPTSRIYCRSASSLFSTFDFEQLTCYVTRHGKTSRSHQAKYIPSIFQKPTLPPGWFSFLAK